MLGPFCYVTKSDFKMFSVYEIVLEFLSILFNPRKVGYYFRKTLAALKIKVGEKYDYASGLFILFLFCFVVYLLADFIVRGRELGSGQEIINHNP